ncbi:MAG: hypothetical protein Q9197_001520 [Variospora fuerteventurae]
MSLAFDQVRRIDGQLEKLHWAETASVQSSPVLTSASVAISPIDDSDNRTPDANRLGELQAAIKLLSTTTSHGALLSREKIQSALVLAKLSDSTVDDRDPSYSARSSSTEQELEWLLVSKAVAQTHGLIIHLLLEQTLPLGWDIWYWDEVLTSSFYLGLYSIQTSPLRLWQLGKYVYADVQSRLGPSRGAITPDEIHIASSAWSWSRFYGLITDSIRDYRLAGPSYRPVSPLMFYRSEVKMKQHKLKTFRELSACGLGILVDEGMNLDGDEAGMRLAKNDKHAWKTVVLKSIALMENVLRNLTDSDFGYHELEDLVFTSVEDDTELSHASSSNDDGSDQRLALMVNRLDLVLQEHLPNHVSNSKRLVSKYGRPSRIIRYWIPTLALLLSSSTLLRIAVNRKAELATWIRDLGATTVDFWNNWVVEPIRKVVGTIRHDKEAEIAIMSKESLRGDQASLERMVVDFARDNPPTSDGASLGDTDLAKVRAKVREGDLTPVLRAYEKDLRRPFMGTVRGNLIRALLIQVQKTKVDVEIAVGGIDALLKSQELVFGFVGLTPGVLVCLGLCRWVAAAFGGRKGRVEEKSSGQRLRLLRNIDRILIGSLPSNNGILPYKDHGMLLCEIHILRQSARRVMPGDIFAEFLGEINELVDLHTGIERQIRVIDRIRWAYHQWMR